MSISPPSPSSTLVANPSLPAPPVAPVQGGQNTTYAPGASNSNSTNLPFFNRLSLPIPVNPLPRLELSPELVQQPLTEVGGWSQQLADKLDTLQAKTIQQSAKIPDFINQYVPLQRQITQSQAEGSANNALSLKALSAVNPMSYFMNAEAKISTLTDITLIQQAQIDALVKELKLQKQNISYLA